MLFGFILGFKSQVPMSSRMPTSKLQSAMGLTNHREDLGRVYRQEVPKEKLGSQVQLQTSPPYCYYRDYLEGINHSGQGAVKVQKDSGKISN